MTITSLIQIIWSVSALGLIILVLLHSPKGDGIGAIGGQAQLFTSAKSAETTLNRVTWTLFVIFTALTVIQSANWLSFSSDIPANSPIEVETDLQSNLNQSFNQSLDSNLELALDPPPPLPSTLESEISAGEELPLPSVEPPAS